MREIIVLFPQPLLPTKAIVCPAAMDREKPWRMNFSGRDGLRLIEYLHVWCSMSQCTAPPQPGKKRFYLFYEGSSLRLATHFKRGNGVHFLSVSGSNQKNQWSYQKSEQ